MSVSCIKKEKVAAAGCLDDGLVKWRHVVSCQCRGGIFWLVCRTPTRAIHGYVVHTTHVHGPCWNKALHAFLTWPMRTGNVHECLYPWAWPVLTVRVHGWKRCQCSTGSVYWALVLQSTKCWHRHLQIMTTQTHIQLHHRYCTTSHKYKHNTGSIR